eukprot:SM000166S02472  [mRNA]  locus=s166:84448:85479:- [translate_table: standard]
MAPGLPAAFTPADAAPPPPAYAGKRLRPDGAVGSTSEQLSVAAGRMLRAAGLIGRVMQLHTAAIAAATAPAASPLVWEASTADRRSSEAAAGPPAYGASNDAVELLSRATGRGGAGVYPLLNRAAAMAGFAAFAEALASFGRPRKRPAGGCDDVRRAIVSSCDNGGGNTAAMVDTDHCSPADEFIEYLRQRPWRRAPGPRRKADPVAAFRRRLSLAVAEHRRSGSGRTPYVPTETCRVLRDIAAAARGLDSDVDGDVPPGTEGEDGHSIDNQELPAWEARQVAERLRAVWPAWPPGSEPWRCCSHAVAVLERLRRQHPLPLIAKATALAAAAAAQPLPALTHS